MCSVLHRFTHCSRVFGKKKRATKMFLSALEKSCLTAAKALGHRVSNVSWLMSNRAAPGGGIGTGKGDGGTII
jgi:hypothetical protein